MQMRVFLATALGVVLAAAAGTALGDNHGDGEWSPLASEVLTGGCAGCHGTDGQLSGRIPSISGRPVEVLEAQLRAFRSDSRQGTMMNRIVGGLTDEELEQIARHFSAIEN